jgi:hypothetical protein
MLQNCPVPESETSHDTTFANQHGANTRMKGLTHRALDIVHFYIFTSTLLNFTNFYLFTIIAYINESNIDSNT